MKCTVAAFLMCWATPAWAQAPITGELEDSDDEVESEASESPFKLSARVFVRDTLSRVDIADSTFWRHDRAIDQGRVQARYDRDELRINLEVELSGGDAELKDTYIRVEPSPAVQVQVGRFKAPMSFIGLESKWSLPSIERGLLSEIDEEERGLPFAGVRLDGLSVRVKIPVATEPELTLATFQTPLASGLAPLDPSEELTQDLYGRVQAEVAEDLDLAVGVASTGRTAELGRVETFEHGFLASVELAYELKPLRLWLEGFAGESMFHQADGTTRGTFYAGRVLVSAQFRKPIRGVWRIEPFVGANFLEPTNKRPSDRVTELSGGLMWAVSKFWRLQLEIDHRTNQGANAPLADSTLFRLQLAAAFEDG